MVTHTHATPANWLGWRDSFLEMLVATRGVSSATREAYGRDLADFFAFAANATMAMESISHRNITDYLNDQAERHMAGTTLARRRSTLTQWFKFLISERICAGEPHAIARIRQTQPPVTQIIVEG